MMMMIMMMMIMMMIITSRLDNGTDGKTLTASMDNADNGFVINM